MSYTLLRGDAMRLPLADESVDLAVTSPPYYGQRGYEDGEEVYTGQIGCEPTPQEYLANMWAVTRELWRVLKPGGSAFVNLGDKRTGSGSPGTTSGMGTKPQGGRTKVTGSYKSAGFGRDRSKMLLPHRYAIGCEDGLADPDGIGWIVRQDHVWGKTSMPEPTIDRTTDTHEYFFHLTKSDRPYSCIEALRGERNVIAAQAGSCDMVVPGVVTGRRPVSVWHINGEPFTSPPGFIDHTAPFPSLWPERLILGWSPPGICTACGEGRRPLVLTPYVGDNNPRSLDGSRARNDMVGGHAEWGERVKMPDRFVGWVCACTPRTLADTRRNGFNRYSWDLDNWTPPPTTPSVVLDVFGGTGTTAGVAHALGRHGISVDMSGDYLDLARWRIEESSLVAKVQARVFGSPRPARKARTAAPTELALF